MPGSGKIGMIGKNRRSGPRGLRAKNPGLNKRSLALESRGRRIRQSSSVHFWFASISVVCCLLLFGVFLELFVVVVVGGSW